MVQEMTMEPAKFKSTLPQEGTSSAGESLPEHSSGCPTVSGGGKVLRDSDIILTTTANTRTTDIPTTTTLATSNRTPVVVIERDLALDRFTVNHWAGGSGSTGLDCRKRSHIVDGSDGDVMRATPSKVTTARRGKAQDPGSSAGVTRATAVGEAGRSTDCPIVEPPSCKEACDEADVGVLEGIEFLDPARLRALAKEKVDGILEVAKKSGNLKGTFVKSLKEAAWTLHEVVATALTRTVASETLILRRETRKLRQEVADLRAELTSLRSRGEVPPAPPLPQAPESHVQESLPKALVEAIGVHMERMERTLRVSLGEVVTARIEALDDRLLPSKVVRPPLAADKRTVRAPTVPKPKGPKSVRAKPAAPTPAPVEIALEAESPLGMEWVPLPGSSSAPAPDSVPETEGWSTVTRRRKKREKAPAAAAKPAPASLVRAPRAKPKRKLPSTPRSAAVIVTLRPEAVERGVTYKSALMGVSRDALTELGIGNLSLRPAATGSRIIEIPGARGPEQAGGLAAKLKEALSDIATVAIPVKRANVRVIGLDETVSVAEVVAVAAAKGGCEPALIRAGEIRPYGRGSGAIHLSLPAVAAKTLLEAGRLLVGWSAARVRLLEDGPLRCFRCLDVGHTRPVCQSAVDRGALCFRCGQPGHKALQCAAVKLHCALCADSGRPAEHHMGGAKCRPPLKKVRAPPAPRS